MATTLATTFTYLLSFLLPTLIIKGSCGCSLNNINIGTARTGRETRGKPEWHVTVTNNCSCAQSQILLACNGFRTTESVDPSMLSVESGGCLLIGGKPLKGFGSVSFSYAWDPPFLLMPKNSLIGPC